MAPRKTSAVAAEVRRFPFPYRGMLAICSDLDETPSLDTYLEQLRFLNTTSSTTLGVGAGLEVGNSLYFNMAPGHLAYWNCNESGRAALRTLIRSGHLDCLHSFGDIADSREHAARALDELARHDCQFRVWVDHAVAPTNFGQDIMQGHGDVPGHRAYHADLTVAHGVRYVWRGRVTSVIGQDTSGTLSAVFDSSRPLASLETIAREGAKQLLARGGHRKYRLHAPNRVLQPATLRDGSHVQEFLRCNPHCGGVSSADTGDGIADVLNERFLNALVERGGACVLYTHLGKLGQNPSGAFGQPAITAFRRLAEFAREQRLLVTTTRRLLEYTDARDSSRVEVVRAGAETCVSVTTAPEIAHDGLTIYVETAQPVRVLVNGREVEFVVNAPDSTGCTSISLPWRRLEFPTW